VQKRLKKQYSSALNKKTAYLNTKLRVREPRNRGSTPGRRTCQLWNAPSLYNGYRRLFWEVNRLEREADHPIHVVLGLRKYGSTASVLTAS
jgi:hypothetical protein